MIFSLLQRAVQLFAQMFVDKLSGHFFILIFIINM